VRLRCFAAGGLHFWCTSQSLFLLTHSSPFPSNHRESLSLEQRGEQLRIGLPELRGWGASVDEGHVAQAVVGEDNAAQPLVDALDGALFRKQVSALHSWREWGCWAHVAALRVGCVQP
jgi:hypothetical protein